MGCVGYCRTDGSLRVFCLLFYQCFDIKRGRCHSDTFATPSLILSLFSFYSAGVPPEEITLLRSIDCNAR